MIKLSVSAMLVMLSVSANAKGMAGPKVIYQEDDRIEVEEASATLQTLAAGTVTQIKTSNLVALTDDEANFKFSARNLSSSMSVCKEERFSDQPNPGNCSGFLVAPDLVVTAGHCIYLRGQENGEIGCSDYSYVFDFHKGKIEDGLISKEKVYSCKKVLNIKLDGSNKQDFALIQLDRPVTDRAPVKFRTEGKVEAGAPLVVIGAPSGLPTKIAGGAVVNDNENEVYFEANLDTFGGNSGSAVFNADTGEVEGILVRGATDYVMDWSRFCRVVNKCDGIDNSGFRCMGEEVTRISQVEISKFLGNQSSVDGTTSTEESEEPALALLP